MRSAGWGRSTALRVNSRKVNFVTPVQRQVAIGLGMVLKEWHPVEEQLGLFHFPFMAVNSSSELDEYQA